MSLFDSLRDKAAEMFSGASDQVGDVASSLPGADVVGEQTAAVSGAAEGYVADAAGMAQDFGGTATEAVAPYAEAAQDVPGAFGEAAAPYTEAVQDFPGAPEAYRP
jgi:hypothetical protein